MLRIQAIIFLFFQINYILCVHVRVTTNHNADIISSPILNSYFTFTFDQSRVLSYPLIKKKTRLSKPLYNKNSL